MLGGFSAAAIALVLAFAAATPAAAENRTLSFFNTHTKETLTVTYKRNGRFDRAALKKLNWFLRDWRRDEQTKMDPELFDLLWTAYRKVRGKKPIWVVSGYRSPVTNAMLRKRSRGVAKFSQHTLGKALDFYIPGVNLATLRKTALKMHQGGVGYYPGSRSPFVHLDTGRVRHWPRMSRKQLVRLFPDGKTLHIPSDGKPLKGYKLALAESKTKPRAPLAYASGSGRAIKSGRSRTASGQGDPSKPTFLAALFSRGEDDREEIAAAEGRRTDAKRPRQELRSYPASPASPKKPEAETAAAADERPAAPPEPVPPPEAKPTVTARLNDPEPAPAGGSEAAADSVSVPRPFAKPKSGETVDVAALNTATPPTPPQMAIAADRVPLPLSNPYRLGAAQIAEAADVPLPPQKPLVVASIPQPREDDAPAPIASAFEPAAGTAHEAPETLSASAAAGAPPATAPRRPSLPVLAFNGSRIDDLTGATSAHSRGYARLSHPVTASAGIFHTPPLTVETHFGSGGEAILDTDSFTGPAIKAVKTVWLK